MHQNSLRTSHYHSISSRLAAAAYSSFSSDRVNSAVMTKLKSPHVSPSMPSTRTSTRKRNLYSGFLLLLVLPIAISLTLYRFNGFDPAPMPEHSLSWASVTVSNHNSRILEMSERIGEGNLDGPEDLAYDVESGFIYTTCGDGWIKRVKVTDSGPDDKIINKVENWVHIGGRSLGLVFGPDNQLIIAESYMGKTLVWDVLWRYPFVRKISAILAKVGMGPQILQGDGGVLSVDLDGKMVGLYTDSGLAAVTGGIKIGDHLYYDSLIKAYISRLDLTKQAA